MELKVLRQHGDRFLLTAHTAAEHKESIKLKGLLELKGFDVMVDENSDDENFIDFEFTPPEVTPPEKGE